jgi:2-succinyl-6-hydroxy-2,4-cyclohexadiene-1-carboxylate synthase
VCTTNVWTDGLKQGPLWLGLHGFTGSGADFAPWFAELSDTLSWEAPDLPGHGSLAGAMASELASMDACNAMLRARIESASRPVIVVGYSLGGRVALNFASQFSHLIAGLVLIGANPGLRDEGLRQERLRWEQELCERLRRDGVQAFMNYWQALPIIETQKRIPENVWHRMQERRLISNAEGLIQSIRTMGTGRMTALWENLRGLICPVLYCAGQEDEKYCAIGREVAELVPQGQFVSVPGAGHAAHLEAMGSSASLVRTWYESI